MVNNMGKNGHEDRVSVKQNLRKKLIIKTLIEAAEPVSVAEITKKTSSNYPTINSLLSQLKEEEIVTELGLGESTGGRRPTLYRLNNEKLLFAGIEVGHTNNLLIIMNIENRVIHSITTDSREIIASKNPLKMLADSCHNQLISYLEGAGIPRENLQGVGIGFSGDLFKHFSGTKENDLEVLRRVERKLSMLMKIPVLIDIDVKLMTRAEKWFGKLKNVNNGLCINLTWGIGLGVIMGGTIQQGAHGHLEFGHITVREDGDLCYCGKRGCLETIASGHELEKKAREKILAGEKTMLTEMIKGDVDRLEEDIIVTAALEGDIFSIELITEAAKVLGVQVANLIKLFDPEKIVINGTLSRAGRLLLNPIRTEVDKRALYYTKESVPIETSDLGKTAIALGAASMHIHEFLKDSTSDIVKFI